MAAPITPAVLRRRSPAKQPPPLEVRGEPPAQAGAAPTFPVKGDFVVLPGEGGSAHLVFGMPWEGTPPFQDESTEKINGFLWSISASCEPGLRGKSPHIAHDDDPFSLRPILAAGGSMGYDKVEDIAVLTLECWVEVRRWHWRASRGSPVHVVASAVGGNRRSRLRLARLALATSVTALGFEDAFLNASALASIPVLEPVREVVASVLAAFEKA